MSADRLRLYSAEEVVAILRLGEGKKDPATGGKRALDHLRRLNATGAVRLGKRHFYTDDHIRRLIEACCVEPS